MQANALNFYGKNKSNVLSVPQNWNHTNGLSVTWWKGIIYLMHTCVKSLANLLLATWVQVIMKNHWSWREMSRECCGNWAPRKFLGIIWDNGCPKFCKLEDLFFIILLERWCIEKKRNSFCQTPNTTKTMFYVRSRQYSPKWSKNHILHKLTTKVLGWFQIRPLIWNEIVIGLVYVGPLYLKWVYPHDITNSTIIW